VKSISAIGYKETLYLNKSTIGKWNNKPEEFLKEWNNKYNSNYSKIKVFSDNNMELSIINRGLDS